MKTFANLVLGPLKEVYIKFTEFSPNLVAMAIIIALGVLAAKLISAVATRLLRTVRFDDWSDRMGLTSILRKIDLWAKPTVIAGRFCFGLVAAVAIMAGLNALKIGVIEHLADQFFLYLPRVFSALLILIFGHIISRFVVRGVLIAAVNSGYYYTHLLVEGVRLLLMLMVLAMALEQLQLAPNIVLAAFSIICGGIVLALAISFGVGGIDAARKMLQKEESLKKQDVQHI